MMRSKQLTQSPSQHRHHPSILCLLQSLLWLLLVSLGNVGRVEGGLTQLDNFRNFARSKYPAFATALDKWGYWASLEKVMRSNSVTVLIPNDPTLPSEFRKRSALFAKQIYGLHVVIGFKSASSFTGCAKGNGFLTADLFPPAPTPGMLIWRLNTKDVVFNGSKDARGGAKFIRGDVYSDGSKVRAHVVDRTMMPYKFFVVNNNQIPKSRNFLHW